jgi:hypothetical protein
MFFRPGKPEDEGSLLPQAREFVIGAGEAQFALRPPRQAPLFLSQGLDCGLPVATRPQAQPLHLCYKRKPAVSAPGGSRILIEWNLLNLIQKSGYFMAFLEACADAIAWRISLQVGARSDGDGELLRFSRSWASARRRSSSKLRHSQRSASTALAGLSALSTWAELW